MIEHKYATFWPRFWAGSVDGLIFMPLDWIHSLVFSHCDSAPLLIFVHVVSSSAFLVYSILMHGKRGQTIGKKVCGVIVLDVSERPLSMRQAVLRDILYVILLPIFLVRDIVHIIQGIDISAPPNSTLLDTIMGCFVLVFFLLEMATMLTNRKRRALHDLIAGSVVVRVPDPTQQPTDTCSTG